MADDNVQVSSLTDSNSTFSIHDIFKIENKRPFCEYVDGQWKTFVNATNEFGLPILNSKGEWAVNQLITNDYTLRKEEWIDIDRAVVAAATPQLRLVQDLRSAGLTQQLANGMGTTVYQSQTQGDISDATIAMDPLTKGDNDRIQFDLTSLPIPVIVKDFALSAREIEASRRYGNPIDTSIAGLAGRKVAEAVEKLTIGTWGTCTFGGGTVYGLTNFPKRGTYTIETAWDDSAITGALVFKDVQGMIRAAKTMNHFGPYVLYVSDNFSDILDEDFKANGALTVRQRLLQIDGLTRIQTLSYLPDDTVVLLEMNSDTIRLIEGLRVPIQTVYWNTDGGYKINFKVIAITVPQVRADYKDQTGLVVGTYSS